jgi:molybdopterin molybdotransferase
MLAALARQSGALALELGIGRDDEDDLRRRLLSGLNHDVLAISGGVSAGVLDLVPKVLAQLGVEQVFHKVNLKPGKPLWFGVRRHADGKQTLVFGLPGNPVSSLVCFELFVRPAIQKLRGLPPTGLARITAQLTMDHQQRGDRPTYWPAANGGVAVGGAADHGDAATTDSAVVRFANHRHPSVTPLPWKGSGDLRTLADADCLAFFPAGDRLFQAGESIEVLLLDESRC